MSKENDLRDIVHQIKELKKNFHHTENQTYTDKKVNKLESARFRLLIELQTEWAEIWLNKNSKKHS
jgi:hypothetical protein